MLWDSLSPATQEKRKEKQLKTEEDMLLQGIEKYWNEYSRAPDEGIPEQQLLDSSIKYLEPFYQEWIDKISKSKKTPSWVHLLLIIGARKMADLTVRSVMRCWVSKGHFGFRDESIPHAPPLAQSVCRVISKDAIAIASYQTAKESYRDDWKKQSKFIKNWSPKRCIAFTKKVSNLHKMTLKQQEDFGHHMLRIAEQSSIIVTQRVSQKAGKRWIKRLYVTIAPELLQQLCDKHKILESTCLLFRPMVVPPVEHTTHRSGGYLNHWIRKEVVHRFLSNYYTSDKHEQKFSEPSQLVLNGLNALSHTEWSVNTKLLSVMNNMFISNTCSANLPAYDFSGFSFQKEYPQEGTKETQAMWCQEKEEAWGNWFKEEQKRARMLIRLKLAESLIEEDFFYMPQTLDFRGRSYTTCELLSCQGSDFDKALIQFAEPVTQTPQGLRWQAIHLANLFDRDKYDFDDRIKWVNDNWEMFLRIAQDPYENKEWISDKKKKNPSFQRLAVIFDITRTDGLTQVPVQIDGKCNGTQHWSAIMGDEVNASLTNVSPNSKPKDLYAYVADKTTEYCEINEDSIDWCKEFLGHWDDGIERSVTKRPTMCDAYGLTFYGIQKYVKSEGHLDWVSKERVGGAVVELARGIQYALSETLDMPNQGKDFLRECAEIVGRRNKHITFTTPSGFKVVHSYNIQKNRRSLTSLFNHKELTFYTYTNEVDVRRAVLGIPPNFIHSLDAAHMFLTISRMIENGLHQLCFIHDSYGCPAPYVSMMREYLREEFCKIHTENQLEKFKKEVQADVNVLLPDVPKRGDLNVESVLKSDYFFS